MALTPACEPADGSADHDVVALRTALLVREHRGFRRAAEVLGVNQSVLSRRVIALEQTLGLRLFHRRSNGAHPTADGEAFLRDVARALQLLQQAALNARVAARGETGRLSVGHMRSGLRKPLQDLLRRFTAQARGIELQLREGDAAVLSAAALNQELDLLVIDAERAPRGLLTRPLWTESWVLVLPTDSPADVHAWREGRVGPVLCCAGDDWPLVQRLVVERGGSASAVLAQETSHDGVLSLVAAGVGCAILPEGVLAASPAAAVRAIPLPGRPAAATVCAAWASQNDNPALHRILSLVDAPAGADARRPD